MSHFPRPDDPSQSKPIPETPRWQKRHLGLAAAIALFTVLAILAWRFSHQAPPPLDGNRPPLPTQP